MPEPETTGALSERARTLIDLGRPADAVPLLLQALRQAPEDARTLCLLSQAHGAAGDHREAERWAAWAIHAGPDGEWGHRLLALHRLNQQRPLEALAPAQEAARLEPDEPAALQILALTQMRLNRLGEAAVTMARLRARAPDASITHETAGLLAIKQRRWAEGEAHCRRALALRPESYYSRNNLGVTLLNRPAAFGGRHLAEAVDCFYRATQIDPTDALARRNLTLALNRYLFLRRLLFAPLYLMILIGHLGAASVVAAALLLPLWLGMVVCGILRYRRLPPALRRLWRRSWWREGWGR